MNNLSVNFSDLLSVKNLELLKNHNIRTSLDFVQTNNEKIVHIISSNVSEIIKIKEKILNFNNSQSVRGDKLYEFTLNATVLIATGFEQYVFRNFFLSISIDVIHYALLFCYLQG